MNAMLDYYKRQLAQNPNSKVTGTLGELMLLELLKGTRYTASQTRSYGKGDLRLIDRETGEVFQVEVKTAKQGIDRKYRFCLAKNDKYGVTNCQQSQFIILVCIPKSGTPQLFAIPATILKGKQSLSLPPDLWGYAGKYAPFRTSAARLELGGFSYAQ